MPNPFSNLFSQTVVARTSFVANDCQQITYAIASFYRSIFGPRQNPAKSPQIEPKSDIVERVYDLSINRYKEVVHEEVEHRPPQAILDELEGIEKEITQGMKQLRGMLK